MLSPVWRLLAPMSLVPRTVLLQILDDVNAHQAPTVATPLPGTDTGQLAALLRDPLVKRARSTPSGLAITLEIPLTSAELIYGCFSSACLYLCPEMTLVRHLYGRPKHHISPLAAELNKTPSCFKTNLRSAEARMMQQSASRHSQ